MNFTAKLQKVIGWLLAAILIGTPLVFSGSVYSSFSLVEAVFFRTLTTVAAILLCFILLRDDKARASLKQLFKNPVFLAILFFFVVQVAAALFSIAPAISFFGNYYRFQGVFTQLHYLLFFIVLWSVAHFENSKDVFVTKILTAMMLAGTFPALYGILQKFGFDPFFGDWQTGEFFGRVFGTLGQPNFLGQFLLLTLPPAFAVYFSSKKNFPLACIFLQIVALMLTLSRSSLGGFWIFLFLLSLGFSWTKRKKWGYAAAVGFFALLPLFFVLAIPKFSTSPNFSQENFSQRFSFQGESFRSVRSRLLLWPVAWNIFKERPLLGQGPETFQLVFPKYQDPQLLTEEFYTGFADRAHNFILDLLGSSGILGLFSYLFFLSLLFGKIIRTAKNSPTILCLGSGLAAFLITNLVSFEVIPQTLFFWATLCLIVIYQERSLYFNFLSSFSLPSFLSFLRSLNVHELFMKFKGGAMEGGTMEGGTMEGGTMEGGVENGTMEGGTMENGVENGVMRSGAMKVGMKKFGVEMGFVVIILAAGYSVWSWNIKPLLADYHFEQGIEKMALEPEGAGVDFAKAVAFYPKEISYQLNFGRTLLARLKQTQDIQEQKNLRVQLKNVLRSIQEVTDREPEFYLLEAEFAELDNIAEATERSLGKAQMLAPNSPLVLFAFGDFYYRHDRFAEAVKIYEQILAQSPPYWKWPLQELAQKSDYEKERYRTFFKDNPEFRSIFERISRAYETLGENQKADFYRNR